jgi:hypothetical protein
MDAFSIPPLSFSLLQVGSCEKIPSNREGVKSIEKILQRYLIALTAHHDKL